jgi:hypothetical protein
MAFGVFVSLSIPVITLTGITEAPAFLNVVLPKPTTTLTYITESVGELKPRFNAIGDTAVFRASFTGGQYGIVNGITSVVTGGFEGRVNTAVDPLTLIAPTARCSFSGTVTMPAALSITLPRVVSDFTAVPTVAGYLNVEYRPVVKASLNGLVFNAGALRGVLPACTGSISVLTQVTIDDDFVVRLKSVTGRFRGVRV